MHAIRPDGTDSPAPMQAHQNDQPSARHPAHRWARARRLPFAAAGLALALASVFGAGCFKSALSTKDDRSQYDRYDHARNERAPTYVQDEFGRRQPNLRGRLLGND